ncbi:TfoX/Sxy family DNA transformation protein [Phaeovulum sp.]|uniref:TfoX/Sxy family DNA transformation protein n=1 Tax=Phaeovulum sp. TaxID=2934796 RepID=UPI00273002C3|nr:TfoX/Sxy family DNA transformation protein [Phaeovulum sp.]MDP1669451.1 TfoX/Sxy family DNA transformation protein [Phaeovulum sp.]MDZ4118270.1 TfoX/Sxy family DNA transformation protein [Phaeovulum sp.]
MPRPLTEIPNIGPATAAAFARVGIDDADRLAAIGADAAYALWLAAGNAPHFIGYYALVMGLQGRPWNDCRGAEKVALRARFDALKENAASPHALFERRLDEIGLRAPRAD